MSNVTERYSTPCYIIHKKIFQKNLDDIRRNFENYWKNEVICSYSCKTNNNEEMIKLAEKFGMYAEVVSSHEYCQVKNAGFKDHRIIYNGPYKGEAVYSACNAGAIVNIDNLNELEEITSEYYNRYGKYPKKLGLRVNFDLESAVPGQTSTGIEDGRFGICYENGDLEKALIYLKKHDICLSGLHIHYTTKTRSLEVYEAISRIILDIINTYKLKLTYIDIGGGFWGGRKLESMPTMEEYASIICKILDVHPHPKLILEPGSALCSTVIEYMSKVISTKDVRNSRFVVLDGTSLHINPFQYVRNAKYVLEKQNRYSQKVIEKKQILCGATCLEKDRFACAEEQELIEKGDIVKFLNVGAYTMSFLSDFILEKPQIYLED